jgi:NADP-dependent 3-hydroxy acid dehydrogenase YdfG
MSVTMITGASSGIGRGLALALAARGEMIVAVARRKELLDTLVLEIEARGGRALAVQCDVTDLEQVRAAYSAGTQAFGTIDRIVANAGGGKRNPVEDFRADAIAGMLTLNVASAANCIEVVLPAMLARGSGHIVLMSSLAARRGLPRATGYSAAKAAMTALGEGLRAELKPRGIDVTVLMPGFVEAKESRKPRPFEVPLSEAAERMAVAIIARRGSFMFPRSLVLITGLLRLLPAGLSDWSVQRVMGPR